jgi:cytoplasmic iron level regulating protein YaaA (DUF328/UPF0246 family)
MGADAFFSPEAASTNEHQHTSKPVQQQASTAASQELVKATFYLTPDHVTALEELKLKLRKKNGERVDKSELVRRAIDILVQQYNS